MDLCGSFSKFSVMNFHTKYQAKLNGKYHRADPSFDAWIAITGKKCPEFDVEIFKQKNPSVSAKSD